MRKQVVTLKIKDAIGTDQSWLDAATVLWQDVLKVHQRSPLHCMVGGGDQLYQDAFFKVHSSSICSVYEVYCTCTTLVHFVKQNSLGCLRLCLEFYVQM